MTPAAFIDNPNWAEFLPEMRDGVVRRTLPTHEDCSRLDVEAAAAHLRRGGTLGSMPNYEERPGQIDVLSNVAQAFNARAHLMIEAGTGVGKSLAYLIPSILWADLNDTPVIVSTATRNLQSQLMDHDIPRALSVIGERAKRFRVALLKGRANYLCLRAVAEFFSAGYWTMTEEEQREMPHFIDWMHETEDGDLDGYDGLPRNLLNCPGEECGGRRCPWFTRCFVYRARRAAAEAHLVIANHALVLAEAMNPGGGLLPPSGRLVLDEAHNLETIATDYLSREFSIPELNRILSRLMRKGRGKRMRPGGVFSSVTRQLSKGILAGTSAEPVVGRLLGEAGRAITRLEHAAGQLEEEIARMLQPAGGGGCVRYRVSGVRGYSLHGLFKPYLPSEWNEDHCRAVADAFEAALATLVNLLHDMRDALCDATPEGEFDYCGDLEAQVSGVADSLVAFANDTVFTLKGEKPGFAYWVERVQPEKRAPFVRLVAAPLSVADDLRTFLYGVKDSVVLCSATLRVGTDFSYMTRRLGFTATSEEDPLRYRALYAVSPFDYFRQSLALAADWLPDPKGDAAGYMTALADMLVPLLARTRGRALVLFTSYEMMNSVANLVRRPLADLCIELLVQGGGQSREAMTRQLKSDMRGVVLFGAQSFWEGVDVAGDALSCVVIARLPFAQVRDPVVEARAECIDRDGGSSFRDYMLPEAVIKFRQGFGRLIRTKTDRGVVVVADPRFARKPYGGIFRKSVPASFHTVTDAGDLLLRVDDFFMESEK